MRSARLTLCSVLALAGVAAASAGCGSQQTNSVSTRTGPGVVVTSSSAPVRGELPSGLESSAVRAFAVTYGRYLDGRLPATALTDATPTAQAQAGAPIPARSRAGNPTVAYIHRAPGADSFTVGYRDRAHSCSAQLALARRQTRWQITQVVAPDLDSILRPSRAIPLTPGSGAAAMAARRFLYGYLPWLYGHARATAIHAGSEQLIDQLKAHSPRVPTTLQHVHPRLVGLGTQHARGAWIALANVTAGQQTYELTVTVARWRVTKVNAPL
jgi:hypothetical protein